MKNIKKLFSYTTLLLVSMMSFVVISPQVDTVHAKCNGGDSRILSFPRWQNGLPGSCADPKIEKLNDIWIVVMNLIEVFLQAVAYIAAGYVVWGGFKYIKSEGEPNKISEAKSAIMSAVVGLVIALGSVAIVTYIQGSILQS